MTDPSPFRIGLSPWGTTLDGVRRVAAAAVDAGADALWLGDGLLVVDDFPRWSGGLDPFVELAWLAGRHPGVGIGVGAAVLPLRDVHTVVKQAATLDQLTEGRFILGVAPGFWEREFAYRGLSFKERGKRFDDLLGALRAALNGEGYDGKDITIPPPAEGGRLSPVPATPGGPPLWLAGARPTFERALRLGLPFQSRAISPEGLKPLADEWFARGGTELAIRLSIAVADAVPPSDAAVDSVSQQNGLVGPPAYLAEQLAAYRDLGLVDVSLIPGRDDDTSLATIETLATAVFPALGR